MQKFLLSLYLRFFRRPFVYLISALAAFFAIVFVFALLGGLASVVSDKVSAFDHWLEIRHKFHTIDANTRWVILHGIEGANGTPPKSVRERSCNYRWIYIQIWREQQILTSAQSAVDNTKYTKNALHDLVQSSSQVIQLCQSLLSHKRRIPTTNEQAKLYDLLSRQTKELDLIAPTKLVKTTGDLSLTRIPRPDVFARQLWYGTPNEITNALFEGVPLDQYWPATPLQQAVISDNIEAVKELIKGGAKLNESPIIHQFGSGIMPSAVSRALEKGERFNFMIGSPLHLASFGGRTRIAELLIENGADINSKAFGPNGGYTPLDVAAATGHTKMVSLLLKHGANPNGIETHSAYMPSYVGGIHVRYHPSPIHLAAIYDRPEVVSLLISAGADIHTHLMNNAFLEDIFKSNVWKVRYNGSIDAMCTPLQIAAASDEVKICKLLLDAGADPNDRCGIIQFDTQKRSTPLGYLGLGYTALHLATLTGNKPIAVTLLAKGGDINKSTLHHRTPLWIAASHGDLQLTAILLKNGANISMRDSSGLTPLQAAAANGHHDIVKLIQSMERGK